MTKIFLSYIHIFMVYMCRKHIHDYIILVLYLVYDMAQYNPFLNVFAVASRNNDRTVAGKSFAWRLLGLMPSISKASTVLQTDEWRSERRARLYHSCIDILAGQINDLTGRDMYFRYGDQRFRRSRVFLDFLCMEPWTAMKCPVLLCVQPHSARLVGVLRASCLTPTLYSRSGTPQMCGKG